MKEKLGIYSMFTNKLGNVMRGCLLMDENTIVGVRRFDTEFA